MMYIYLPYDYFISDEKDSMGGTYIKDMQKCKSKQKLFLFSNFLAIHCIFTSFFKIDCPFCYCSINILEVFLLHHNQFGRSLYIGQIVTYIHVSDDCSAILMPICFLRFKIKFIYALRPHYIYIVYKVNLSCLGRFFGYYSIK